MGEHTISLLFPLLKYALDGTRLNDSERELCTEEVISDVIRVADKHDVAHIICHALSESSLMPDNIAQNCQSVVFKSIYRYQTQNYELERIKEILEHKKLPFILLKGSVLRKYYSSPWLRTSCDIDILVKRKDLSAAQEAITKELGYEYKGNSSHDITLFSESGVCFELHFELNEPDFRQSQMLSDVWSSGDVLRLTEHEYAMSNELFLLFHIYHMAKHFIRGGCGIKPLIDLWIIKNKMGYDKEKAEAMLKENDLYDFYVGVSNLADVWFSDKKHTHITKEIEEYILRGGVYGSLEQHLAMAHNKSGGKLKHLFRMIFLPYKSMLIYYPSLRKFPPLYPLYQVRRWLRIIFRGASKRACLEVQLNNNLSAVRKEKAKILINELGL